MIAFRRAIDSGVGAPQDIVLNFGPLLYSDRVEAVEMWTVSLGSDVTVSVSLQVQDGAPSDTGEFFTEGGPLGVTIGDVVTQEWVKIPVGVKARVYRWLTVAFHSDAPAGNWGALVSLDMERFSGRVRRSRTVVRRPGER